MGRCYPIVAETPSGRLRYKTIAIGRFIYNITGIVQSCLTPRKVDLFSHKRTALTDVVRTEWSLQLVSSEWDDVEHVCWILTVCPTGWGWGAKTALFYAGTNLICNIWCWFRLPETKDRTFGEIDLLFERKVPARKFKSTSVDRKFRTRSSLNRGDQVADKVA